MATNIKTRDFKDKLKIKLKIRNHMNAMLHITFYEIIINEKYAYRNLFNIYSVIWI
jgi:hypothetical protein